tara:strand:+ start:122 stop:490 length:369 start_codon:yes stop_codon:yes gene_type:complete
MKNFYTFFLSFLLIGSCEDKPPKNPEAMILLDWDQRFSIINNLPFYGATDVDYTIANTGDTNISSWSFKVRCTNAEGFFMEEVAVGFNLNKNQNQTGSILIGIHSPSVPMVDCQAINKTLSN